MSWPSDAPPPPDADSLLESPAPETEAPVSEAASVPEPTKRTRRAPRTRKQAAPAAEAPAEMTGPVTEMTAPVVETEPAPAPVRRRGRRQAVSETPAAPAAVVESTPPAEETSAETPAPARRRGRRRAEPEAAAVAAPPVETTTEAAAAPSSEPTSEPAAEAAEPSAPARRRGRRRAEEPKTIAVPLPPELPIVAQLEEAALEAEDSPEAAETAVGESDGKKKRRRGRRRRGADETIAEPGELTDLGQPLPEPAVEEEEKDVFFVPPPPPPVYVAPPLVPSVLAPPEGAPLPRTAASVRHGHGLPRLVAGDQEHLPYAFFVNPEAAERGETVDSQIRMAAAAGVHLFSGVMYLPLKNAYGDRSFGAADALVQQILAADPDAYVMPRLQFAPTNFWLRTHPDQLAQYAAESEGDVSLASSEFWADCVDALDALIAHFADPGTPGGDRIAGFHLDRGEWFTDAQAGPDTSIPNRMAFQNWLQAKYQAPYALRAAWYDGQATFDEVEIPLPSAREGRGDAKRGVVPVYAGARDGRWVDYALYVSQITAQIICGLASAIKTLSANRLLVAVSYGYTLEFCTRNDSGHLALAQVLASPDIDIVAGPNSYAARGAGGTGAFGSPIDSVALHGKLWLVEDDTKTFLADAETPDTYNPKIALGADTQAAHQRHFGAALAHNAGVAWMDLWGQGWLDNPEIWKELGGLTQQARVRDQIAPAAQPPDVAVLIDEASLAYLKSDPAGLGLNLVAKTRDLLLRTGASVGFYLQSDITQDRFPDAKLCLFVNALRVTTAERQAIREKLQRPGKTLAWLYAAALFDERGPSSQESSELVGMTLRLQPWNSRGGSQITEVKHPITERLRGARRIGQDEGINPSYAVSDPNVTILAEYTAGGAPSLAVREHAGGWKSVFLGDPHLSVELLRGLFAYAGVPVYDAQDDIVYAGDGVLLIHAPFAGQRTIQLPRKATVYDVIENSIIATDARSFRVFLRARTTRVFFWGDRAAVAAATGLSLPSPEPAAPSTEAAAPQAAFLPPAPEISLPIPPPLSEPAFEVAMRHELAHAGEEEPETTLEVSDLAAVLEMQDGEDAGESEFDETNSEGAQTDEPARPRSRWQRRRAAARARRDAERQAQASGTGETSAEPAPVVDIAAILPDLPPRRRPFDLAPPPPAPFVNEATAVESDSSGEEPTETIG